MTKPNKLTARIPRGFSDRNSSSIFEVETMVHAIRQNFELYGFEALETPFFEYTDVLGKFLPDQDRPNAGVFSLQDDDEQWISLRYDLTAPLARYVAQNSETLPKPFRSYRLGYVFRNEKPGPGRFRQFLQFDADTINAPSVMADAEICMMVADTMENLGVNRGNYVVRVNNRKVLDGILTTIGLDETKNSDKRLTVLRAIDKLDRLAIDGVKLLLGKGRKDESGDFTKGAELSEDAITTIVSFLSAGTDNTQTTISNLRALVKENEIGVSGVNELEEMATFFDSAGYSDGRIIIDPSVVRGLEYYTGPVYEVELTFEVQNEKGRHVVFGSVAGGGRYDGLVSRFPVNPMPATGISIGVSRLAVALQTIGALKTKPSIGPVVICVLDRDTNSLSRYLYFASQLRKSGIPAEVYQGNPKQFGKQLQYADKKNSPCVIIQGTNERTEGVVQIKDLIEGKRLSSEISDNQTWRESRPAQIEIPEDKIVTAVKEIIARQSQN